MVGHSMVATVGDEPILKVNGLTKLWGRGCDACFGETGPEKNRNSCPECGAIVACAGVSLEVFPG